MNETALDIAKRLKAVAKAKDIAIVALSVALVVVVIWLTAINYRNDCEWREFVAESMEVTE